MMKEFKDKIIVITGAGNGFGRQLAKDAALRGMKVVLADIDDADVKRTLKEVEEMGAEGITVTADLTQYEECEKVYNATIEKYGRCDILVNNAGVAASGPIWELPVRDWQWIVGINYLAQVYMMRLFLPGMIANKTPCHVVNVSSGAAFMASPTSPAYHSTKFASLGLSEAVYYSLAAKGYDHVGISAVCPNFIQTDLHHCDRHRPERFAMGDDPYYQSDEYLSGLVRTEVQVNAGLPIDHFGMIVFNAIEDGQFYVFTHKEAYEMIRMRMNSMIDGNNPDMTLFK